MYINDIHILYYVFTILLAIIVGDVAGQISKKFIENADKKEKKTKTKTNGKGGVVKKKKANQKSFFDHTPSYGFILVTACFYCLVIYVLGIKSTLIANLDIIKYMCLIPMLEIGFVVDVKKQIIPNRLNLTLLETGLIFTFLYGLSDITISFDMLLGGVTGCAIFMIITLVGKLLYGKEAMGMGDVKLITALGLFFGFYNIVIITLLAFLIGAVISIFLVLFRQKEASEYIAFGPFIVISALVMIFVPSLTLKNILMNIFTLGYYSRR